MSALTMLLEREILGRCMGEILGRYEGDIRKILGDLNLAGGRWGGLKA